MKESNIIAAVFKQNLQTTTVAAFYITFKDLVTRAILGNCFAKIMIADCEWTVIGLWTDRDRTVD
jgi:hypothetical protein